MIVVLVPVIVNPPVEAVAAFKVIEAALVPSIVVAAAKEVASTLIEVAEFAVNSVKGAVPRSI